MRPSHASTPVLMADASIAALPPRGSASSSGPSRPGASPAKRCAERTAPESPRLLSPKGTALTHRFFDNHTLDSTPLLSVTALPPTPRGRVVVEVSGEIDQFTAPLLDACLQTQSGRRGVRELVVDMEDVAYLGAAGISVLTEAGARCRRHGARLLVRCNGRPSVVRPLRLCGLMPLLGLDASDASGGSPGLTEWCRRQQRGR